jgi:diacylglycerol kinase (ATP)
VLTRRRKGHERLDRHTGRHVVVSTDDLEEVELDGDIIGSARRVEAWVDPLALVVRVEATTEVRPDPEPTTA